MDNLQTWSVPSEHYLLGWKWLTVFALDIQASAQATYSESAQLFELCAGLTHAHLGRLSSHLLFLQLYISQRCSDVSRETV